MKTAINTGGGASVHDVNVSSGDFVGRDKYTYNTFVTVINQIPADYPQLALNQRQTFDWAAAEQSYCTTLLRHYNRLRIFGKSQDDTLDKVFVDLYMLEEPTALRPFAIHEMTEKANTHQIFDTPRSIRLNGMTLVNQDRNLYVLGKPGAGKTTFLRWVAVQRLRQPADRLPIFVSLHEWATSSHPTLLSFIVEQFALCHFPQAQPFVEHLLQQGRALILFDGLDEVKQDNNQRLQLAQSLHNFTRQYDRCQFIITCRIAADEYRFPGFKDVEVADFTTHQIEQYAAKWFGKNKAKFEAFQSELQKSENQGLRELCTSPLMLGMLCVDFDHTLRFPPNRAELYERALSVLLKEWDAQRSIQRDQVFYRELSPQRKIWLFAAIAKSTFEQGRYLFQEATLTQSLSVSLAQLPDAKPPLDIDGLAVLKAIEAQHSIFVERARGVYSFGHLTFHEYFTARYLVDNRDNGEVSYLIRHYLTDNRWREVFLLTASLLPNAKQFIADMQQAIDRIIKTQPAVVNLLRSINDKVTAANVPVERQSEIRLAYIITALGYSIFGYRSNTDTYSIMRTLDGNDYIITLLSDKVVIYDIPQYAQEIANLYSPNLGLDYILRYLLSLVWLGSYNTEEFLSVFADTVILSRTAGDVQFTQALSTLVLPTAQSTETFWSDLAKQLVMIIRKHRDLVFFSVGDDEVAKGEVTKGLNSYLYACDLLLQCLKVAIVSDRQMIMNSLFLPPTVEPQ